VGLGACLDVLEEKSLVPARNYIRSSVVKSVAFSLYKHWKISCCTTILTHCLIFHYLAAQVDCTCNQTELLRTIYIGEKTLSAKLTTEISAEKRIWRAVKGLQSERYFYAVYSVTGDYTSFWYRCITNNETKNSLKATNPTASLTKPNPDTQLHKNTNSCNMNKYIHIYTYVKVYIYFL
jgi:hypothetical protein